MHTVSVRDGRCTCTHTVWKSVWRGTSVDSSESCTSEATPPWARRPSSTLNLYEENPRKDRGRSGVRCVSWRQITIGLWRDTNSLRSSRREEKPFAFHYIRAMVELTFFFLPTLGAGCKRLLPNGSLPQNRNLLGIARGAGCSLRASFKSCSRSRLRRSFYVGVLVSVWRQLPSIQFLLSISWTVLVGLFCVPYILWGLLFSHPQGEMYPQGGLLVTLGNQNSLLAGQRVLFGSPLLPSEISLSQWQKTSARGRLGSSHGTDVWLQGKTLFPRLLSFGCQALSKRWGIDYNLPGGHLRSLRNAV